MGIQQIKNCKHSAGNRKLICQGGHFPVSFQLFTRNDGLNENPSLSLMSTSYRRCGKYSRKIPRFVNCINSDETFLVPGKNWHIELTRTTIVSFPISVQVNKDDGLTEFICDVCWIQTETFHQFYKKVEQIQERFFDSVAKDKSADNEVDCADKVMETDVDIAMCEETELRPQVIDSQIGTSNDSEYDSGQSDFPDEAEESEVKGTECSKNGRENADAKSLPHVVEEEPRLLGLSSSERIELEGQIRDLFNMNCEICSNVTFGTISDARKHYRRVHQKAGYLMCCGKPFQYTYGIVQHLRHHINLDVNGTPDPEDEDEIREWFDMKCDICGDDNKVEFKALREVQRHFRKVHSMRGYLRSTCCNTKLRSRPNMLNHIRWHKNTGPWKCEECDITFRNKFRLTTHMANRHTPLDAREFNCTLCSSKFALAASLRSHVKNKHTSKTGEKFNCNKCTKRWGIS